MTSRFDEVIEDEDEGIHERFLALHEKVKELELIISGIIEEFGEGYEEDGFDNCCGCGFNIL